MTNSLESPVLDFLRLHNVSSRRREIPRRRINQSIVFPDTLSPRTAVGMPPDGRHDELRPCFCTH